MGECGFGEGGDCGGLDEEKGELGVIILMLISSFDAPTWSLNSDSLKISAILIPQLTWS